MFLSNLEHKRFEKEYDLHIISIVANVLKSTLLCFSNFQDTIRKVNLVKIDSFD